MQGFALNSIKKGIYEVKAQSLLVNKFIWSFVSAQSITHAVYKVPMAANVICTTQNSRLLWIGPVVILHSHNLWLWPSGHYLINSLLTPLMAQWSLSNELTLLTTQQQSDCHGSYRPLIWPRGSLIISHSWYPGIFNHTLHCQGNNHSFDPGVITHNRGFSTSLFKWSRGH